MFCHEIMHKDDRKININQFILIKIQIKKNNFGRLILLIVVGNQAV